MAENITFKTDFMANAPMTKVPEGGPSLPKGDNSAPEPDTTPTTQPSRNAVSTTQLEASVGANVAMPDPTPQQRFEIDVSPEPDDSEVDSSRDELIEGLRSLKGRGEYTEAAAEAVGLDEKRKEKTKYDNQIRAMNREFDLALRDADDEFGTRAQKNAIKGEITRKFNRRLADKAILQMAAAGEFNDAQAAVNRKVELEFQDRQAEIDALKFIYGENKERYTLDEQRMYQKRIKDEERAYKKEYDKSKTLEDMKLSMLLNATEAGAGEAAKQNIQNASSVEGLLSVPGASTYTKSKADRLSEQLASVNLQKAQQSLKEAATNLTSTGISPVTNKVFSEGQSKAGTFAVRMDQAEEELSDGRGVFIPFIPGFAKSSERRQFEQAEQNFITAVLRRESGAAIADSEYDTAREVYIPTTTDDQDTLDQKAAARQAVLQGMKNESVGAYEQLKGSLSTATTGSTSSYIDQIEESLSDPYGSLLSGLGGVKTSTPAISN